MSLMAKALIRTMWAATFASSLATPVLPTYAAVIDTLYNFTGGADGGYPLGGVVQDTSGTLYGTTFYGGSTTCASHYQPSKGCGTIYSFNSATGLKVLATFAGPNGAHGSTTLALVGTTLYGATERGGAQDDGVVFSLNTDGSGFRLLHQFTGVDGKYPEIRLAAGLGNVLYGVTMAGGSQGTGVLFSITPAGAYTVLHDFTAATGTTPNALLVAAGGTVIGSTDASLTLPVYGDVFSYVPETGKFSIVYAEPFVKYGGTSPLVGSIGPGPTLYGADTNDVFSFTQAGGYQSLGTLNFYNLGDRVQSGPLLASNGTLYGILLNGVENEYGDVYSLQNGTFQSLYLFTGKKDGGLPLAQPIFSPSGALLGTTTEKGDCMRCGTIWSLEP